MTTNINYITDWNTIHHMKFNKARSSGHIGQRVYIPANTVIAVEVGRKIFNFKTTEPTWSDKAIAAIRKTEKYVLAVAHYNHLYLDRVEKAIKAGKEIPKQNLKIMFTYTGRTIPKKEPAPLRPLTKEENQRLVNRNRARLGLAPLTFA